MACAACRLWKRGVLLLAICFVVAVTMLVYLPAIRAYGDSAIVTQFEVGLDLVMAKLGEALAGASPLLLAAWIALAAIAVVSMIVHVIDNWRATDANARLPSLELYCLATGLIALTVGFAFFQANGMYPFPWHFIPFITLAGVIVEVGIRSTTRANWISVARIAAAAIIVAMSVLPIWKQAHLRRTNLDLLCHTLEREAGPDDRIILMRFWLAPGFGWQYHGSTPWEMIPAIPMSDEAVMAPGHFQKQAMLNPDVLDPTLESIQKTLASGHRVWLVGDVQFLPPNARPPKLEPPPHPKYGWNNNVYGQAWSMQVAYFLQTHADRADSVPVQVDQPISRIEDMPLWVVNGWRR